MNVVRPLWHMGPLHPVEQFLTLFLAFAPFVVLGIVIWLRRRADDAAEEVAAAAAGETDPSAERDADSEAPESPSHTARPAD